MTETVRRVRQDSLGIYRRDAPFERFWLEPGEDATGRIGRLEQDRDVVKVIHEVPLANALGLRPAEVWVRRGDRLVRRGFESGRVQVDVDFAALRDVCRRHDVRRLLAFGSVLDDYFDANSSDVDVIVEFAPGVKKSLFDLGGLVHDLSSRVFAGRDVDVVEIESLDRSPLLRDALDDAQVLFEDGD